MRFTASPALVHGRVVAVAATERPITFRQDADRVGLVVSVPRGVLLGFLDVALVEQGGPRQGAVARLGHRGRDGLPGQFPAPPGAEVHVEARPPVKGQRVEEGLHGVQDALKEGGGGGSEGWREARRRRGGDPP